MKKFSKEYAEELAWDTYPDNSLNIERAVFVSSYMKAIEETNVKELLDVAKMFIDFPKEDLEHYKKYGVTLSLNEVQYNKIINAISKAQKD